MKILQLEVKGLKHCPRNSSHRAIQSKYGPIIAKTEIARQYMKAIHIKLLPYVKDVKRFKEAFDPKQHHLVAVWELWTPNLFTKEGKVSENSIDLDAHKVMQDAVFEFIGIDDAYIMQDSRRKVQGDYAFALDLRIRSNNGEDLL